MRLLLRVAACIVVGGLIQGEFRANEHERPMRLDDRFREEDIGAATFAPDGQALVVFRVRPALTQPAANGLRIPNTRGDIWIQSGAGAPLRNITNGIKDDSGWWAPKWSPSGKRLMFFSSRGGDVTLWQWERATDKLSQVSKQPVDLEYTSAEWLDDTRIICLALPEGESAKPMGRGGHYAGRGVELATQNWERAARGELTVHVVDSLKFKYPLRHLMVMDVETGRSTTVGTTWQNPHQPRRWWVSPDKRLIAFARPDPAAYPGTLSQKFGTPVNLELTTVDGQSVTLQRPLPKNILTTRLEWSTGNVLAFFALDEAHVNPELLYGTEVMNDVVHERSNSREQPARLWLVKAAQGRVEEFKTGDVELGQSLMPPAFSWVGDVMLFRAARLSDRLQPRLNVTPRWLALGLDGQTTEWSFDPILARVESMQAIGGKAFVTLIDGEVWRIDADARAATNLTATFASPVLRMTLAEPNRPLVLLTTGEPKNDAERALVRHGHPLPFAKMYSLDVRTGTIAALTPPASNAWLSNIAAVSKSALFSSNDANGIIVWRTDISGNPQKIVEANEWRKTLVPVEVRTINYIGGNGEKLQALLSLPYGYKQGRRVPIVVDSDINYTSTRVPYMYDDSHAYDAVPMVGTVRVFGFGSQYAAAGFGYLWVSVPTATGMDEVGRGNLLQLTSGILPAVEKAVELGYADPDRLFIDGHSSFGYGVYGVVTQTGRFKAAIARAGWVDQAATILSTDFLASRTDNPFDYLHTGGYRAYSDSELPYWKNGDHYRRNSPLSYVDRVKTPLLIVHGELDPIEVSNAERFFKALVIQRKPAQLVRYWGEAHTLRTPVNYVDSFLRMYAWLDRWGDISRDANGNVIYDGDRVKSRGGSAPLEAEDYRKFYFVGAPQGRQTIRSAQNN